VATIVAAGLRTRDTVLKVERLLHFAEYKRRQAAPRRQGGTLEEFVRSRTAAYPIVKSLP